MVLLLVPLKLKQLKRLWPAGLIGFAVAYGIDSTLIALGAFRYSGAGPAWSGVPVFYLLSAAASSMLLAYYYPGIRWRQSLFVAGAALVFLLAETVMEKLNYFHYLSWSPANSYLLDVVGIIVVLWLARVAGAVGRGP